MIPYKLRLRNFLSYKEPPEALDFSGMHLACLIGANGHGKSALLDAITWALWGKARGSRDDDLMHSGSTEMEVAFEFGLGGGRYRVMRKRYGKGKTKKSLLELAIWNETTLDWQPLTEPSLRVTQKRLDQILRMDYETFTNSAFLRQGEADAFTSKAPGQRKDILAAILNLSEYDTYAERAKNLAKSTEAEVRQAQLRLDELDAELGQRSHLEAQQQTQNVLEAQARLARTEADRDLLALQVQLGKLEGKQALQAELTRSIGESRRALTETEREHQQKQQRMQDQTALLAQRSAIEADTQQLLQARTAESHWQAVWQQQQKINDEKHRLEQALAVARAQVENDLAQARGQVEETQKLIRAAETLRPKAAAVTAEIQQLATLRQQQQQQREQLATLRAEAQSLQQESKNITLEGTRLKERLQVLQTETSSNCPVCKQPLGVEGRQHLQSEYEQQLESLRQQVRGLQQRQNENTAAQQTLKAALAQADKTLKQLPARQKQLAQIEAHLQQGVEAEEHLPALQEQVAHRQALLDGDFAPDLQAQWAAVQARLQELAYDAEAHKLSRLTLQQLRGAERRHALLQEALQQQALLSDEVLHLQERAGHLQQRLQQDEEKLAQLNQELASLPALQAKLRQKKQAAAAAHAHWEQSQAQLIRVQQQLQTLQTLETVRKEVAHNWSRKKIQARRYRQLQEAFGPRGVQAMIIENALPELETEANRLLRRLSDGRMNVQLPTTRQTKAGGVRETLDIIISDELGTRPYELYSGGEAFRVDLALRVALSRLLARRAGAALQTLFIDEGFGTQDAHGRENLIDALHMIKDEFALVLVITHIEELKDQFPVRIQISKDEVSGSYFTVE
ncbi:MAG: SMC family ATPase [Chloroflexi bacterium]|nr:SMC family ATPase [Chloroflexota bacterium]